MNTSEKIDQLIPCFIKAQAEIGTVKKNGKVKVEKNGKAYGWKYALLSDIIDYIREILTSNKLSFVQSIESDSTYRKLTTKEGEVKEWYETLSVLKTRIYHESGQFIESKIALPCKDQKDAHALGSAITYARRYSLVSLLGIPQEDDDGVSSRGK